MSLTEISCYIWEGDDLDAGVNREVTLSDGSVQYANIGSVKIKKGDILYKDHGASYMEQTMTGYGPASQYPYGRVVLAGVGAVAILNSKNAQYTKLVNKKKFEFDEQVLEQVQRTEAGITLLIKRYAEKAMENKQREAKAKQTQEIKRKEIVNNAIKQMEEFFNGKKNSSLNQRPSKLKP